MMNLILTTTSLKFFIILLFIIFCIGPIKVKKGYNLKKIKFAFNFRIFFKESIVLIDNLLVSCMLSLYKITKKIYSDLHFLISFLICKVIENKSFMFIFTKYTFKGYLHYIFTKYLNIFIECLKNITTEYLKSIIIKYLGITWLTVSNRDRFNHLMTPIIKEMLDKYSSVVKKIIWVYNFCMGKIEIEIPGVISFSSSLVIDFFFTNKHSKLRTELFNRVIIGINNLTNYILIKMINHKETFIFLTILVLYLNPFMFLGIVLFISALVFWNFCVFRYFKEGDLFLFFSCLAIFCFLILASIISFIYGIYFLLNLIYAYMKRTKKDNRPIRPYPRYPGPQPGPSGSGHSGSGPSGSGPSGSGSGPSGSGPSGPSGPSGSGPNPEYYDFVGVFDSDPSKEEERKKRKTYDSSKDDPSSEKTGSVDKLTELEKQQDRLQKRQERVWQEQRKQQERVWQEQEKQKMSFEALQKVEIENLCGLTDFDYDASRVFNIQKVTGTDSDGRYFKRPFATRETNVNPWVKKLYEARIGNLHTQLDKDWTRYKELGYVLPNQVRRTVTVATVFSESANIEKPKDFPCYPLSSDPVLNEANIVKSVRYHYVNFPVWTDASPFNRVRRDNIWDHDKEFREKLIEEGKRILRERNENT